VGGMSDGGMSMASIWVLSSAGVGLSLGINWTRHSWGGGCRSLWLLWWPLGN
jgi:hypothetical protein